MILPLWGGGNVKSTKEFSREEYLGFDENLIINEILKSETGIVREGELEKTIVYRDNANEDESKKNKYGFSVALNFSPVILLQEDERGRYHLTGLARS